MPYNMEIVSPNRKKRMSVTSQIGWEKATKQKQTASQLFFIHWVRKINSK